MGYLRRAKSAPSPMEMLAILTAKETGVTIPEISARTHYARSSIIRWWKMWGRETAFVEAVKCEVPDLIDEYSFDALYPKVTLEPESPAENAEDSHEPLDT